MDRLKKSIGYALSRTEAYLIVVLVFVAVVVAILGGWPGIVIIASVGAGVVLLALLIADSLTNPDVERDAAIADIDIGRVKEPDLKAKVRKALQYVRAAQRLSRRDAAGILDTADDELPQLEHAARSIFQMSLRLQEFRADGLLYRDLRDLKEQKGREEHLGRDREAYLETLVRLNEMVRAAEREIDSALAHLGRSYAEMQAIKVTPELRGRAAEALGQLEASALRLGELAQGYDEVYSARALTEGPELQR